ncbi:MAG TPA: SDR family NAD(P)-dependent oxidoreductase [Steroidobacteraceae bacterium]
MTSGPPSFRSRTALGLTAAAAMGRFELQVCRSCGAVQYPPREACHRCLCCVLDWRLQPAGAELLSETTLFHSHDEFFRTRLPIRLGLVRLDSGPSAVVFLDDAVAAPPRRVRLDVRLDRAGQGVLFGFSDGAGVTQMTQSKLLREMSCDPRGRKVLVTDAASALGVALVRALVDAGADTVWAACIPAVTERSERESPAGATPGGLGDLLGALAPVRFVSLDVMSDDSVQGAADQIASQLDILINNAESCAAVAPGTELEAAHAEMDTNYFGLLRLARAFVPALRTRAASAGAAANVPMMAWVNLLSLYALTGVSPQSTFAASKAAAHSFSQAQRAELLPAGVRVINVFPGPEMAPGALAQAIVKGLQEGREDLYPGEVAQDWLTQWRDNPEGVEREPTTDR